MTKRFVKVVAGVVTESLVYYDVDENFDPGGLTDISSHAQFPKAGWTYDSQTDTFTAPPP